MDRSNGPNFYHHARKVGVRIAKETRYVLGIFELITGSFSENSDERSRAQTASVALRSSDFPDGIGTGVSIFVNDKEWFTTAPSAERDGYIHLMLHREILQRTTGKFTR